MQQPALPLPGCLDEIGAEPREPGSWLHPERVEEENLILRGNESEREAPLSRLNGVTWVPVCLSTLVIVGLLALGTALTVSLDAHGRATPELRTKFLVVGDWGRNGSMNQSEVACAMARMASVNAPDFIISTGDNFYENGLTSVADTQLDTSFSSVYGAASLQGVPWHAVLGNHDYGELWTNETTMPHPPDCPPGLNRPQCHYGPLHQLDVRLAARDARWHCERWFSLALLGGVAEIFFIDTSPGVLNYRSAPWAANPGGILSQSWDAQLLELEARLGASRAHMKLVVGHHPVRSRRQEDYPEIGRALQPLLEQYGVAAYMCGHEHNLQHLHADGEATHYIVSGGGSKTDYSPQSLAREDQRLFHQGSGFVACELTAGALTCNYFGISDASYWLRGARVAQWSSWMLQVTGRKADAKLGSASLSAELALRKAAVPGLGSSEAYQADDKLKATRGRAVEAARDMAPKAQDRSAARGATPGAAASQTRMGAASAAPHAAAGKAAPVTAAAGNEAAVAAPLPLHGGRIGRARGDLATAGDLGPARRSGGSGSGGAVGGGGRALSGSEGGGEGGLQAAKSTSDEELARRLHQQLNGPALPTALTRQRKRKQPVFYTPEAGGGHSAAQEKPDHPAARDNCGVVRPAAPQAPFDRSASEGEVLSGHRPAAKKLRSAAVEPLASPPAGLAPVRVRARERTEQTGQRPAAPVPAAEGDMKSASCAGQAAPQVAAPETASGGGGGGGGVSSRELRALVRSQMGGDSTPNSPPASHRQGGRAGEGSCGGSGRPHSAPFGSAPRAGEAGSEEGETPRNRARSRAGSALKRDRSAADPDAVKQEEESLPDGGDAKHMKVEAPDVVGAAAAAGASTSSEGDSHSEDGAAAAAPGGGAGAAGGKPKRQRKIPKLPMVRHGKKWYRARLLKEAAARVLLEFTGFEEQTGPLWLPKDSDRIWRGSYKGRDWRYLGAGAWEPKQKTSKKAHHAARAAAAHAPKPPREGGEAGGPSSPSDDDEEDDDDEDASETAGGDQLVGQAQVQSPRKSGATRRGSEPFGPGSGGEDEVVGEERCASPKAEASGDPAAVEAEPAAVRRPGSAKAAAAAAAHAAGGGMDAATTPLGGKPASLGAVKPDTPAKNLECKAVLEAAPEASTDSGAAPGSSIDANPNPAGGSGGSGETEDASAGGERGDLGGEPRGGADAEEGEPVRERRTSRKKARAAVAAAAAAAAGDQGAEEDEPVAPAAKTKRASARHHSRVDAGRAASAAADDAAAALLAVKADVSGALAADAAEGVAEGLVEADAEGLGLAAAAEGLALLECEEALPSDEPASAARAACGGALPSPLAKPVRHLGWKGAWKKTHKLQAEAGSSDSGSDPAEAAAAGGAAPAPAAPPTSPGGTLHPPTSPGGTVRPPNGASLRPARRTRKPLRVDNSGAASPTAPPPLAPATVTLEAPESSEDTAPPPPEPVEEPEVATPGRRANGGRAGAGRGRNGGNGGRGGRARGGGGGGRWARHRAALAAAAAAEPAPAPPDSPDERAAARVGRPAGRARPVNNHRLAEREPVGSGPAAPYSTRSLRNGGALTASGPLAFASLMGALGALEKRQTSAYFGSYGGGFGPAAGALAAELAVAMSVTPGGARAYRTVDESFADLRNVLVEDFFSSRHQDGDNIFEDFNTVTRVEEPDDEPAHRPSPPEDHAAEEAGGQSGVRASTLPEGKRSHQKPKRRIHVE
ncbi:hypothetical protein WJX81_000205 [Elliptochloris bilobata]|uniref:Calcineurin-like phosphoesterase domain-containing protein n=1 Tax=Elliptochloris bilobata TaxID=381761 RepID=A0AAW1S9C3_9CHLO